MFYRLIFSVTVMVLASCSYFASWNPPPAKDRAPEAPDAPSYNTQNNVKYSPMSDEEITQLPLDSLRWVLQEQNDLINYLFAQNDSLSLMVDSLNGALDDANDRVAVTTDFQIPLEMEFAGCTFNLRNDRVYDNFKKVFDGELVHANRYMPRMDKYFAYFDSVFTRFGVPTDVKYLAVAESYLSNMAASPVGAGGIWQFMPGTAADYGLKVNGYIDERRNVLKATTAAARYLQDSYSYLKRRHGTCDWPLVFATYNAGPGSIDKVMTEQGGKNFFEVIMKVDETNKYVWRALALKMIHENEEKIFGKKFEREPNIMEECRVEKISLRGYHRIDDWAQAQGTVVSRVLEYNPWIKITKIQRRKYSPINNVVLPPGTWDILVPRSAVKDTLRLADITGKLQKESVERFAYHTVKKGETLVTIAKQYGVSVQDLCSLNNLRTKTAVKRGQKIKIRAELPDTLATVKATPSSTTVKPAPVPTPQETEITHVVKKGETLAGIAGKYSVSAAQIKKWNSLKKDTLKYGQRLVIKTSADDVDNEPLVVSSSQNPGSHQVSRGETLISIANNYGVSTQDIREANELDTDVIMVGQKLKIPNGNSTKSTGKSTKAVKAAKTEKSTGKAVADNGNRTHTVKRGETLGAIAKKYDISINDLKKANNIQGSNLKAGQKLKIPA